MDPVSVALLSTLLPTCVLIFMLSCLSVYLYLRRRDSGPQPLTETQVLFQQEEERQRKPRTKYTKSPDYEHNGPTLFGRNIGYRYWSDPSHPDLVGDMRSMFLSLGQSLDYETDNHEKRADNEIRIGESLDLLGYRGIAPATVFKLLQRPATRCDILGHIWLTIGIDKTSLDNDPQSSLLPLSTDAHKHIIDYIKANMQALRGLQLSPEVASRLMRIPATVTDWPVENRDKTAELIRRLHWPYRDENHMPFNTPQNKFTTDNTVEQALDSFVYGRYLMLASSQQLEFRWPETSDTCFAAQPDVYATSGEDGVLLDEPKLLRKGKVVTIPSEDDSTLGN